MKFSEPLSRLKLLIKAFLEDKNGSTPAEYAIMASLIAVTVLFIANQVGQTSRRSISETAGAVLEVTNASSPSAPSSEQENTAPKGGDRFERAP
ncbi:MAG: Flp family type IVb pilin [Pseudomonadota bacterium]